jgi:hypothetical protein
MVDTTDASFDATLVLDGQYTPPSGSFPDLSSILPHTQIINMSRAGGKKAAADTRADSSSEVDEQDDAYEGQHDDHALDDDDAAHRKPAAAAAAAAPNSKKRKSVRVGKWSRDDDLELCSAVLAYVKEHQGQLPGAARTGKSSTAPSSWKQIAARVDHAKKLEDKDAAARACSTRWSGIRAGAEVRTQPLMSKSCFYLSLLMPLLHAVSAHQDKAKACYATFLANLQSALEDAASQELDDDMKDEARTQAKQSMARKKMAAVKQNSRVMSSSAYGYIAWDKDYVRTEQEEKAWQDMSDIRDSSQQRDVMSSADCLPVCLSAGVLLMPTT